SLAVFCATRHPPRPTRFPYTTLFRSRLVARFRARLQVSRQRLLGAHARRRLLGEGAARSQPHRRRRPRAVRVRRIVFLSNAQLLPVASADPGWSQARCGSLTPLLHQGAGGGPQPPPALTGGSQLTPVTRRMIRRFPPARAAGRENPLCNSVS